jgi:hypothetical protein
LTHVVRDVHREGECDAGEGRFNARYRYDNEAGHSDYQSRQQVEAHRQPAVDCMCLSMQPSGARDWAYLPTSSSTGSCSAWTVNFKTVNDVAAMRTTSTQRSMSRKNLDDAPNARMRS